MTPRPDSVRLVVRHIADCPSLVPLAERIPKAAESMGVTVDVVYERVDSLDQEVAVGFSGSPTLLIDGSDPFADDEARPTLACRLYRNESGLDNAPSVEQIRAALALA